MPSATAERGAACTRREAKNAGDEERKAKRGNDYEHIEDHAERAKHRVVGAELEGCIRVTGKKLIGVRWVDVEKEFGVHRSRLVAKDFRPKSSVNNTEGVYAATPPPELVKFLFSNAAANSRRDMFAMSCSSTSGKRTCMLRLRWSKTLTTSRTSQLGKMRDTSFHALWIADCSKQLGEGNT